MILEDHDLTRMGLCGMISSMDGFKVLFESARPDEFLSKIDKYASRINVCIYDIFLNDKMNGLDVMQEINKRHPHLKSLIVTRSNSEFHRQQAMRMGASGFLLKSEPFTVVRDTLLTIKDFGFVKDIANLNLLSEDLKFTLDEREIEIIKYFCTDLIYPAIAHKMKVTVKSLDHRRQVLFKKLHITNRASMVFFALQNGIVDVEDKNLYLQHI
ncbi:MAG: hypothetical protein RL624_646 [Bacteroidota bacterium]